MSESNGKPLAVIKVGSDVIKCDHNGLDTTVMGAIASQIAELAQQMNLVLVSSGAVIAGKSTVPRNRWDEVVNEKGFLASRGQPELMRLWSRVLEDYRIRCNQVLASDASFQRGNERHNIHETLEDAISMRYAVNAPYTDSISVVNGNDSSIDDETRDRDNDDLAADIAIELKANRLVILSAVHGLYTGHPEAEASTMITSVQPDDDVQQYVVEGLVSEGGTGGMGSKINALQTAARAGINGHLGHGKKAGIIPNLLRGNVGTHFVAREPVGA